MKSSVSEGEVEGTQEEEEEEEEEEKWRKHRKRRWRRMMRRRRKRRRKRRPDETYRVDGVVEVVVRRTVRVRDAQRVQPGVREAEAGVGLVGLAQAHELRRTAE